MIRLKIIKRYKPKKEETDIIPLRYKNDLPFLSNLLKRKWDYKDYNNVESVITYNITTKDLEDIKIQKEILKLIEGLKNKGEITVQSDKISVILSPPQKTYIGIRAVYNYDNENEYRNSKKDFIRHRFDFFIEDKKEDKTNMIGHIGIYKGQLPSFENDGLPP